MKRLTLALFIGCSTTAAKPTLSNIPQEEVVENPATICILPGKPPHIPRLQFRLRFRLQSKATTQSYIVSEADYHELLRFFADAISWMKAATFCFPPSEMTLQELSDKTFKAEQKQ